MNVLRILRAWKDNCDLKFYMKQPFFQSDDRSFRFLNMTQFLGALNDNVFKLFIIYLMINLKGTTQAPKILAVAGAIFVIPPA